MAAALRPQRSNGDWEVPSLSLSPSELSKLGRGGMGCMTVVTKVTLGSRVLSSIWEAARRCSGLDLRK